LALSKQLLEQASYETRDMPFGAAVDPPQGIRFRLWAPKSSEVLLELEDTREPQKMTPVGGGWHELVSYSARPGDKYRFVLSGGYKVPDPASRYQPKDVHGASEIIDPSAYQWSDNHWRGRPWHEFVIYELHVGTFTAEGTFSALEERLDYLRDLGINAIELMPIADFPGRRNWGYDGVLLFAPESSYGRPDDLKRLVDAAHARGLSVILDVVYNHFGPDGNYLPIYAPIFTDTHQTAWGAAVNFDAENSDIVRAFVIENAAYWIREYHFDGLRLDAVHAIKDDRPVHILTEIADAVRNVADGRHVHLILENEGNQASLLERDPAGRPLQFTAQWNDDVHHALHAAATGERSGYYEDYAGDAEKLGRALAQGFAFQGEVMGYSGRVRGEKSDGLPPTAFVSFIQNHDQVGNRAFGERLTSLAPKEAVRALVAINLLAPQIPMLFMGEEWGADQPFAFFCDFEGELADAVRNGRRAEFAKFPEFSDPLKRERIPDPTAPETFLSAKLHWDDRNDEQSNWLGHYRRCLAVRRSEIVPRLAKATGHSGHYEVIGSAAVRVRWSLAGSQLWLVTNLSSETLDGIEFPDGRVIFCEGAFEAQTAGPFSVLWILQDGNE
jgi:maltooligosyltrehalose trehalohydrolase